jgi:hypothetical protein
LRDIFALKPFDICLGIAQPLRLALGKLVQARNFAREDEGAAYAAAEAALGSRPFGAALVGGVLPYRAQLDRPRGFLDA